MLDILTITWPSAPGGNTSTDNECPLSNGHLTQVAVMSRLARPKIFLVSNYILNVMDDHHKHMIPSNDRKHAPETGNREVRSYSRPSSHRTTHCFTFKHIWTSDRTRWWLNVCSMHVQWSCTVDWWTVSERNGRGRETIIIIRERNLARPEVTYAASGFAWQEELFNDDEYELIGTLLGRVTCEHGRGEGS